MEQIPKAEELDSTISVAKEGYNFVSNRCRKLNSDVFLTRLMSKKTICMQGREAAGIFYDPEHFERKNVPPGYIKSTLLGRGSIQGLDGDAHKNRKQMFMSLMRYENIHQLADLTEKKWIQYSTEWGNKDQVVLFYEVEKLLCEAICEWIGIPLTKEEVDERARDQGYMIEGAGTMGIRRHIKGRKARNRTEKWIEEIIEEIRTGDEGKNPEEQNALQRFAWHRDTAGELLDNHTVAVEIINLIRPTVAVSRYFVFAALALHHFPEKKKKMQSDEGYVEFFVNEVRRYYPFFPFNMARVKKSFKWRNYQFPEGIQVLMDFHGTNHDPRLWDDPETFNPDRFRNRNEYAYDLIPQGGGDYHQNHRCAGEWITIGLMKQAVQFLTNSINYKVPEQNLEIDLSKIPAIPESRFVIEGVQFS